MSYSFHHQPTDTLTFPIPNAHFIWYCAWLTIPSTIYAYSQPASTHLAIVPASVFITSILYWANPLSKSWRRKLDIAAVLYGIIYNTHCAFHYINNTSFIIAYSSLLCAAASCYGASHYFMARGEVWPSTYAHASVHVIGNIANTILYYGVNNHHYTNRTE